MSEARTAIRKRFHDIDYDKNFGAFVLLLQDCSEARKHGCKDCEVEQECNKLYGLLSNRVSMPFRRKLETGELLEFVKRFVHILDLLGGSK